MTFIPNRDIDLSEACYVGNYNIVSKHVNRDPSLINDQNPMNGYTPLHWACKGNQNDIVSFLIQHGADQTILNSQGKQPYELASDPSVLSLFGVQENETIQNLNTTSTLSGVKPMRDAVISNYQSDNQTAVNRDPFPKQSVISPSKPIKPDPKSLNLPVREVKPLLDGIVLRAKITGDPYFIEFLFKESKFSDLQEKLKTELDIHDNFRIVKFPDTLVRNDWDVSRLIDGTDLCVIFD
eukprot:TRINITY_DN11345_c0_g1_i1.p1 TRINITY_DN11345_c0_g1~~TRINITY_DN11345_c0_g1_i1.p1  ORF type:complete len:238 (-),score=47.96 TRINITY_DN11345_c0_g1_i1:42-755(-)